ncbi:hypothetical protein ACNKHR_27760 [Shigella flexneri]
MYSLGDGAKNAREAIYHIEGDPDHPVSRGALCPKGRFAGLRQQRKPSALPGISCARF